MPPKRSSPLKGKKPPEPEKPKLKKGDFYPPPRRRTMTEDEEPPPPPPEPAKPPVTTVVVNGTNQIGTPSILPPTSPHAVLNNLVSREILDPSGPLEPISNTVVTFQAMVQAMSKGTDITPYKDHIQRIASNQPEKNDVVHAFQNQIAQEMLADMEVMRANSLRVIKRASGRNDVSVSEALVIWRTCNEQIPELEQRLNRSGKSVDTLTVVEKIDYARQQAERVMHREWEGTSPQGRELIRKKLWEVKREVAAQKSAEQPAKSS